MAEVKDLNSTAVYAWTTLISVFICVPAALIMEGPRLQAATQAIKGAHPNFYVDLLVVRTTLPARSRPPHPLLLPAPLQPLHACMHTLMHARTHALTHACTFSVQCEGFLSEA